MKQTEGPLNRLLSSIFFCLALITWVLPVPVSRHLTSRIRRPSAPHLPFEVIEQIILHLTAFSELPDLCNCSLVSRAWLLPTRKHLFDTRSFCFPPYPAFTPRNPKLKTLRTLHSSPLCTLVLDRTSKFTIRADDSSSLIRQSDDLKWCTQAFKGIKTITIIPSIIDDPYEWPYSLDSCIIQSLLGFRGITTLDIWAATFDSPDHFYELLEAMGDGLETLNCREIRVRHEGTPAGVRMLPHIRTLLVDFLSFFRLIEDRFKFPCLEELDFEEASDWNMTDEDKYWVPPSVSEDDPFARWEAMGQALSYFGKDLVRLTLRFERDKKPFETLYGDQKKQISKYCDLSVQMPLLQAFTVTGSWEFDRELLLYIFRFSSPHQHLSCVTLSGLPDAPYRTEFDGVLQRFVPRLKRLQFEKSNITRELLNAVEEDMRWCKERECLCPMFVC